MKTKSAKVYRDSVLVAVLSLLSYVYSTQTTEAITPTVSLEIESCGEWIEGVPLWLVATFKNNEKERDQVGPSHIDFMEFKGVAHSWQLKRKGSSVLAFALNVGTCPYSEPLEGRAWPGIPIPSNGSYRMVYPLQWQDGVWKGKYELSVRFNKRGSDALLCAATTTVVVRMATETEMSFLDLVRPCGSDLWSRYEVADIERMPKSLNAAFGFELLLRGAATSKGPISALDPEKFRLAETTLFDPELAAVRYEILVAQGKKEAAQELREKTLVLYPGVKRLFDKPGRILWWLWLKKQGPQGQKERGISPVNSEEGKGINHLAQ